VHDCDASVDLDSCINRCEHYVSLRAVYRREDFVEGLRVCAAIQACVPDVDRAIDACESDVRARLVASAAARSFCAGMVARSFKCGDYRWDEAHCIESHKTYSDAILGQLNECLDQPCRTYGRCMVAVVGDDPVATDRDRFAEFRHHPVPDRPRSSVTLGGRVLTEANAPVSEATVCVHGFRDEPCVLTSHSGGFSLSVPALGEVAIVATASGFGKRLIPVATTGANRIDWRITLVKDAVVGARYAALGVPYPDDAAGFLFATADAPPGSPTGLEGVTMTIDPPTGRGPVFFAPTSDPDPGRKATSTWSSGIFGAIAPGEVTLTLGPPSVTCTPLYGGWRSAAPNSIRLVVAAGFETVVTMACHR
jgi:hypothetical protein